MDFEILRNKGIGLGSGFSILKEVRVEVGRGGGLNFVFR